MGAFSSKLAEGGISHAILHAVAASKIFSSGIGSVANLAYSTAYVSCFTSTAVLQTCLQSRVTKNGKTYCSSRFGRTIRIWPARCTSLPSRALQDIVQLLSTPVSKIDNHVSRSQCHLLLHIYCPVPLWSILHYC